MWPGRKGRQGVRHREPNGGGAIEELCLSEVGGSTRCWEWSKVRLGSQLTETPMTDGLQTEHFQGEEAALQA